MRIVAQRDDGVQVIRLEGPQDAEPYLAAFVGAYQDIWSEPPYNERFFPEESAAVLRRALEVPDNITLLAVRPSGSVVGFGIGYPVRAKSDVARAVRGLLPVEDTIYFADMGVLEQWRAKGLGHQFVHLRLQLIDRQRWRHVLLRTSAVRNTSYEMYRKIGFEDTGVYMEVPARRQDGASRTDRRLFLSLVL